jgi:hypothetical protein
MCRSSGVVDYSDLRVFASESEVTTKEWQAEITLGARNRERKWERGGARCIGLPRFVSVSHVLLEEGDEGSTHRMV